jgi:hypothetical protein
MLKFEKEKSLPGVGRLLTIFIGIQTIRPSA